MKLRYAFVTEQSFAEDVSRLVEEVVGFGFAFDDALFESSGWLGRIAVSALAGHESRRPISVMSISQASRPPDA